MISRQRIEKFWEWFSSVAGQFGEHLENDDLVRELDARVADLGAFSWELGPGLHRADANALVLTPCGDPGLLEQTKAVIAAAPECPGWEFYPAKPPKQWQRRFELIDARGREIDVDASASRYVLLRYPDGVFDIVVADASLARLPKKLQKAAIDVLLDGELGEERRMVLIHGAEIVSAFSTEMAHKSSPIESLSAHLRRNI